MDERSPRWPRRATSCVALVHVAYVVFPVIVIAGGVTQVASDFRSGNLDGGTEFLIGISLPALIGTAVIGLAIVSPLLTWLTCLAVGLWKGRSWSWVGGCLTFTLTALAFPSIAVAGEAPARNLPLAAAFAAPSILGLAVLVPNRYAFRVPVRAR